MQCAVCIKQFITHYSKQRARKCDFERAGGKKEKCCLGCSKCNKERETAPATRKGEFESIFQLVVCIDHHCFVVIVFAATMRVSQHSRASKRAHLRLIIVLLRGLLRLSSTNMLVNRPLNAIAVSSSCSESLSDLISTLSSADVIVVKSLLILAMTSCYSTHMRWPKQPQQSRAP